MDEEFAPPLVICYVQLVIDLKTSSAQGSLESSSVSVPLEQPMAHDQ